MLLLLLISQGLLFAPCALIAMPPPSLAQKNECAFHSIPYARPNEQARVVIIPEKTEEEGRGRWRLPFGSHTQRLELWNLAESLDECAKIVRLPFVSTAADPILSGRGLRTGYVWPVLWLVDFFSGQMRCRVHFVRVTCSTLALSDRRTPGGDRPEKRKSPFRLTPQCEQCDIRT